MPYFPLLILVSSLPLISQLWAIFRTPDGKFFLGANTSANLNDIIGVYFASVRNFSEGDWLYRNPYDLQSFPFFHYPVYLVLGKIASVFSTGEITVYFLACAIFTFYLLFFIIKFLKIYFDNSHTLLFSLGLSIFGGFFAYTVPEASAFFSFWEPHFIVAQAALIVSFYALLKLPHSTKILRNLFFFSIATFVLGLIHPWMLFFSGTLTAILLCILHFSNKTTKGVFWALVLELVIGLPILFYYGSSLRVHWNSFPLNTVFYLPLQVYGFLLVFSFLGICKLFKTKISLKVKFIILWFVLQIIFIYLPFPFQRRFIEGLYLPVGILAVHGVEWTIERFKFKKIRNIIYTFTFIFLSIGVLASYVYLFFWLPNDYVYRNVEEKEAWDFTAKSNNSSGKFLSLPLTSTVALGRFDFNPYAGHEIQTPDFENRNFIVNNFYKGKNDMVEREEFLRSEGICYVYLGTFEKKVAKVDFEKENYLEKIFSKNSVEVYKSKWCR